MLAIIFALHICDQVRGGRGGAKKFQSLFLWFEKYYSYLVAGISQVLFPVVFRCQCLVMAPTSRATGTTTGRRTAMLEPSGRPVSTTRSSKRRSSISSPRRARSVCTCDITADWGTDSRTDWPRDRPTDWLTDLLSDLQTTGPTLRLVVCSIVHHLIFETKIQLRLVNSSWRSDPLALVTWAGSGLLMGPGSGKFSGMWTGVLGRDIFPHLNHLWADDQHFFSFFLLGPSTVESDKPSCRLRLRGSTTECALSGKSTTDNFYS